MTNESQPKPDDDARAVEDEATRMLRVLRKCTCIADYKDRDMRDPECQFCSGFHEEAADCIESLRARAERAEADARELAEFQCNEEMDRRRIRAETAEREVERLTAQLDGERRAHESYAELVREKARAAICEASRLRLETHRDDGRFAEGVAYAADRLYAILKGADPETCEPVPLIRLTDHESILAAERARHAGVVAKLQREIDAQEVCADHFANEFERAEARAEAAEESDRESLALYRSARDRADAAETRLRELERNAAILRTALKTAEAALADIGDADREPGDNLQWCERRAVEALPAVRAAIDAELAKEASSPTTKET